MTAEPIESRRSIVFLGGLGLGAGLMYLLDPRQGARRRSLAQDKASHAWHAQRDVMDKGIRDLGNRAGGLLARMRAAVFDRKVSDDVLVERIRARLGHCVTHPGSIEVSARKGRVTLRGPLFTREVDDLLHCASQVRGVRQVENQLEPHRSAKGVPGLQGQPRRRPRSLLQRESWPPAVRLLATGTGLSAGFYGLRRGGLLGELLAGAGTALVVRSVTNMPARRLLGLRSGRRGIDLHKTITIDAPVEEVYAFWTRFENLPRFMEHVREVRASKDGRLWHWKVKGPGGSTIAWDAEVTVQEPNHRLAWRTLPNATVEHAGIIHFEKVDDDRTRLDIRMSYQPPAGAIGHLVAKLFHTDPKTAMDDDLVRLKTLFEGQGVPHPRQHEEPASAARPELH